MSSSEFVNQTDSFEVPSASDNWFVESYLSRVIQLMTNDRWRFIGRNLQRSIF